MSIMNLLDEYDMWYFPNLFNDSQKKKQLLGSEENVCEMVGRRISTINKFSVVQKSQRRSTVLEGSSVLLFFLFALLILLQKVA